MSLPGCDVGELPSRDIHRQQRIEVNIGVDGNRVRLLFGDGRLRQRRGRGRRAEKADNVRGKIRFSISAPSFLMVSVLESCLRLFLIFLVFAENSAFGSLED